MRVYQRVALLRPVAVESNRYRRYDLAQVRTGQLIGMLRGADASLTEIPTPFAARRASSSIVAAT